MAKLSALKKANAKYYQNQAAHHARQTRLNFELGAMYNDGYLTTNQEISARLYAAAREQMGVNEKIIFAKVRR